jgi:hypothetical protein
LRAVVIPLKNPLDSVLRVQMRFINMARTAIRGPFDAVALSTIVNIPFRAGRRIFPLPGQKLRNQNISLPSNSKIRIGPAVVMFPNVGDVQTPLGGPQSTWLKVL